MSCYPGPSLTVMPRKPPIKRPADSIPFQRSMPPMKKKKSEDEITIKVEPLDIPEDDEKDLDPDDPEEESDYYDEDPDLIPDVTVKIEDKKLVQCPKCKEIFSNVSFLRNHLCPIVWKEKAKKDAYEARFNKEFIYHRKEGERVSFLHSYFQCHSKFGLSTINLADYPHDSDS